MIGKSWLLNDAIGFIVGVLFVVYPMACSGTDSSCVPARDVAPSAGGWKGSFQLSYQMKYPGAPPLTVKWTGDLDFSLVYERDQADYTGEPNKPGQCPRVPIGGQPVPGCDKFGNPTSGPTVVTAEREGRAFVFGRANAAMHFDFETSNKGDQFKFSAPSQAPATLRATEEREPGANGEDLVAVRLMGSPKQFNFLMNMSATSGSGGITGTGKANGAGAVSDTFVAHDAQGHRVTQNMGSEGKHQVDEDKEMFRLELNQQDCWLMKGKLDTTQIVQSMESAGMHAVNVESAWEATLQERDLNFEKEVDRFAQNPIPAQLTWDYVNQAIAEYRRLLGDKRSNYRLCVAKKAEQKLAAIAERELQILADDYPKVSQGATAPVFCAANRRIEELLSLLEWEGVPLKKCPLTKRARDQMITETSALADKLSIPFLDVHCDSYPPFMP